MRILTLDEQVKYWIEIAEQDMLVIDSLFEKQHYLWCLYLCHLIIEKALKAHYVKDVNKTPPKIHDLVILGSKTSLTLNEQQLELCSRLNDFQIEARYPDYKRSLQKIVTKEFAEENCRNVKELFEWLKSHLK